MKFVLLVSFLCLFVQSIVATAPVPLYAQSLTTHELVNLGTLTYNKTLGRAQVVDIPEELKIKDGEYRICSEIYGKFYCHSLAYLTTPLQYDLILSTKQTTGELLSISLRKSIAYGINAIIKPAAAGAQPKLKAPQAPKTSVVKDESGNSEIVEEEEDEPKSFLQKYWMYILPVVIMLMSSGGGGGQ